MRIFRSFAALSSLPAPNTLFPVREIGFRSRPTNRRAFLDLGPEPDAQAKDFLEFLGQIVPSVVIAQIVGRQKLVH
ncbi:MAG TPA: hypothetical protein VLL49_08315 [Anaerolineales bacterium]|nr:hypothetical protein [Anaerolineales bacterium]